MAAHVYEKAECIQSSCVIRNSQSLLYFNVGISVYKYPACLSAFR